MMENELLGSNYLINDGIKVKEDFVDVVEDSGGDLFPTDYADDGRTEMDPKVDDDNEDGRLLLEECLSFNKRLIVKLTRLPEPDGREKIVKMTNKVGLQKGHQNKSSRVKHQKLPSVKEKTTKSNHNHHIDVDQLIKDCQDNSKRLVIVLERIPIIGKTSHQQVQNNGVKVKRHKLANNEDKYHLKSTLQAKVDNAFVEHVEDKILCVFCQKEFIDYSSRRTHYENDHKSPWSCKLPNCTETFTSDSKNLYVFHKLTHEVENFKYFWDKKMCPICKEHYEHKKLKEFRKHIISHQNQILVSSSKSTSKSSKKTQIKEQFICTTCGKSFKRKYSLNKHTKLVHSTTIRGFRCKDCYRVLKKESTLQDHKEKFHQIFECYHHNCNLTFEGKTKFDDHLIKEHEKDTATITTSSKVKSKERQILTCEICGEYKTFKRDHYNRHQRDVHSTSIPVKCTLCSKEFKNDYRLKNHINRYHQPYKCTVGDCNCTFTTQNKLDAHIRRHTCEKYICHLCSAQIPNFSAHISNHMKLHHQVFSCHMDNCKAEFHTETQLLVHQHAVHDPELKPGFLCPICGLSYWTKKTLDKHRLDHKNGKVKNEMSSRLRPNIFIIKKPFINRKCRICEKEFGTRAGLIKHEKSHERIKTLEEYDGPKFPCSYCDKIYTKKNSLIYHTEMNHTKKLIFKCEFDGCNQIFKTKRNLNDHKDSIHLKIKIDCTLCTKIFTNKSALASHLLKVHKKERDYPFECNVAGCGEKFYRDKYLQNHIDQVHKFFENC